MNSATAKYEAFVARGCLCGTDDPAACKLHGYGDNRGIGAWFKAGMSGAFPSVAICSICRSEGLRYPNVEIDDPKRSGEFRMTLVCPKCSTPGAEQALMMDAQLFGHKLNGRSVFGVEERVAALAGLFAGRRV